MWTPYNFYNFVLFDNWLDFSGAVPSIYWNVYSEEQRYKFLCKRLQKLVEYVNLMGGELNLYAEAINELAELFEQFKEHGFDDYYSEQVQKWIDEHLSFIFEHVVKQVFFGLNDNGYFVAYVPSSWSDIEFDTGHVFGQFDYGRLILRYNADGSGVIDHTGRYDELNSNLTRVMGTLYAPMSEGGDI